MYAILDIETTGGKYNEEGITEIAIYKFDGHDVVDQFISLVNPERPIQPFVANLTGINNQMLRNAPKFYEVAKRIVEITTNCIIVAHNSSFDYRILRTEFSRLGFEFERQSLCTVELSKKLIPDQQSYSLGKLVRGLGIPLSDRHRANGDALATVKLFKLLLTKDIEKKIITETVRTETKRQVDDKLLRLIEDAPTATGVYYMHREDGTVIYIGKSKNIKKRLNQHFTNDNRKSKKIQEEVVSVTYENTGSELLALLKESEEIKRNKPKYNRALRKTKFDQALYQFTDDNGYINFKVQKADHRKISITTFSNKQQAKTYMHRWTEEYNLCQKLMGLDNGESNCFNYTIKQCQGACIYNESAEEYNIRAQKLIFNTSFQSQDMIIVDRGRDIDEQSVILVEEGKFKGIGYFNLNHQINNIEILRSIITPMTHNRDAQHIIQSYVRTHKRLKIIKLQKNV
ncbi:DNA polymerase-3 subunit epsilon [Aquimarina sp. EL_43]|uniref:exonuclease domain-containing protein n=1 Tax=unclassified Aquimarina TaxID=2627091 RepID=UPI0018CB2B22|nr:MULTISPECIES: exonuclease domain-containing protein [unclassified Aquimarina]MBG6132106.1 DNA polymerase-3 subunit epsilon [Aquimarina sp. EL_35]MBG6152903.1 DNA polymerase-3 subunit epsilon [Aquimarina sp. EL_32]MBG6170910.1 DNA polymerase-3 subunit epsilon [Aquimarina sp. EL_43]